MIRVKIANTNLPCENTKIDIWDIVICGIIKNAVSACCYDNNPKNTSCSENIAASLIY